ncbi:MAG: tetratricopeptide repeat protein, partial [Desulfobacteria bacterium]
MITGCSPNYDRIIADSTKGIERNPDDAEAYRERASAWEEKGDYDQAIADCTKAIKIDRDDANAYYFRARAVASMGSHRSFWWREFSKASASLWSPSNGAIQLWGRYFPGKGHL